MLKHILLAYIAVALCGACATGGGSVRQAAPNQRAVAVLARLDASADGKPVRLKAVHMGADSATNRWGDGMTKLGAIDTLPEGYFTYIQGLNVNWVGIMVAIHVTDSMDSNVRRIYESEDKTKPDANDVTPSFTDEQLVKAIRAFKSHGINVYLTLAYEPKFQNVEHPVNRGTLGNPDPAQANTDPKFWPWSPFHPDHASFVKKFWDAYTAQAVSVGKLAEAEGVGLYSLGTETDVLFRTRSGGNWSNDYGNELRAMVKAVREVYSGLLTYDMLAPIITAPNDFYGPGSGHLFHDMGLDVIGVSAYFQLYDSVPLKKVLTVAELEKKWQGIFDWYLKPLQARNDGLPILFTEFGHTDSINAVVDPNADLLQKRVLVDRDNNGFDDGEETQANIYQALFNVMDRNPDLVCGAFLWGMMMADDQMYQKGWNTGATVREHGIRGKLAEGVVRETYVRWRQE